MHGAIDQGSTCIPRQLADQCTLPGPWHKEYPEAKVIGPEGLAEKRKSQKNEDVPFSVVYTPKNKDSTSVDSEFDSNFDVEYVESHANKVRLEDTKAALTVRHAFAKALPDRSSSSTISRSGP